MSFQISPEKSFAENISQLSASRLDQALAKLSSLRSEGQTASAPHKPAQIAEIIHGARKDLKHVRALLRLARRGLASEVSTREDVCLRDASRALSATRDAQVLVEVFAKLDLASPKRDHGPISAATRARLRKRLARQAKASSHPERLVPLARAAGDILQGVRARLPAWEWREGNWRLLAGGLGAVYGTGRRRMAAVAADDGNIGGAGDPAAWHEWRKQVKHLAYQMRLLRPLWPEVIKTVAGELDALAELLGGDHDLAVLQAKFMGTDPGPAEAGGALLAPVPKAWIDHPAELAALGGLITVRRAAIQQRALAIGRRVYAETPKAFLQRFRSYWKAWRREHRPEVRLAAVREESPPAAQDAAAEG